MTARSKFTMTKQRGKACFNPKCFSRNTIEDGLLHGASLGDLIQVNIAQHPVSSQLCQNTYHYGLLDLEGTLIYP